MSKGASTDDRVLVELTGGQLHKLAELVHLQEVEKLKELKFDSYADQQKYLKDSQAARENVDNLIINAQSMKAKAEAEQDAIKKQIAADVYEYCTKAIGLSLQFIRSYNTRLTFLDKLKSHADELIKQLSWLDPATQMKEAQRLALEAGQYKKAMLEYAKKFQHFVPNQFSRWLKDNSIKFEDLVQEYITKLGYKGPFKDLTDIQKLEVYENIIEAAGQGKSVVTYTFEALGAVGVALLVFTAAAMVWDIYSGDNKLEKAARDACDVLTSVISLEVADLTSAALAAGFEAADFEIASVIVTATGAIVGFGVGVVIGIAAGALLDLIFGSGTSKVNATQGLKICRVAPMPDGLALARLVKHNYPDL